MPTENNPGDRPHDPNIMRHKARERKPGESPPIAHGDQFLIEAVTEHFERAAGPVESVLHEILSPEVHLDVHVIPPTPEHRHWTLFTTGCAQQPMNVPPEVGPAYQFAELCCLLPEAWDMQAISKDLALGGGREAPERWYFPIRWLKTFARLPHEYDTWIGAGHTMPNGDPPEPLAPGVAFNGVALINPFPFDDDFWVLDLGSRQVNFYTLVPLYPEEMDFKLEHGYLKLLEALEPIVANVGFPELMSPARPNAAKRGR
ncbi:MAG: suppressor of fused domain protein [Phycisphaeraceae bacterium]|nr:suppressor of fused domain protein [Phycisphaeraceae bacterium]